ncbi:hypothetical protein XENTR_v10001661 [Xenopus tropicalis]|nr:hypothetical protein XENTR_v10001661 [Xenopus tropicalis]
MNRWLCLRTPALINNAAVDVSSNSHADMDTKALLFIPCTALHKCPTAGDIRVGIEYGMNSYHANAN